MKNKIKDRGVGIIIKNNKILLFRRIVDGKEYFIFPGGGIEDNETPEEATIREIQEELTLDAKINKLLFKMYNAAKDNPNIPPRDDYFFLITNFVGEPKLGGEELERMNENDQFYPEWHNLKDAKNYSNLFPEKAKNKLFTII